MTEATTSPPPEGPRRRPSGRWFVAAAVLAGIAAVAVAALLTNIFERRQEGRNPYYRVAEITDTTVDPAVWGQNFPLQYDSYLRTTDQVYTRYGGSEALPRNPTAIDPREVVAQSRLQEDPRLIRMWQGYAFARDFREERGHAYMLEDQLYTERQLAVRQPGACINCHASVVVPFTRAGNGDLQRGFDSLNALPYLEIKQHFSNPISCIDCHDPETMQLRVTRPAFMEGMRALKALEGIENYDVNTMATRQEMRTYVCGQCHVEYYFKGQGKTLTFPWARGLLVDSMYAYYDSVGHNDWTHTASGAGVLKAQHPEFEMYNQSVHARSGVACADCHMPYQRVGAQKVSDHQVRSPLLMIDRACQTCHKISEDELRSRVFTIQDRNFELRNIAIDAVLQLIDGAEALRQRDSTDPRLALAHRYQRAAQFYADFVEAENSMGFHASQEASRILGNSINFSRVGQAALRGEQVPASPLDAARESAHRPRPGDPEPIRRPGELPIGAGGPANH